VTPPTPGNKAACIGFIDGLLTDAGFGLVQQFWGAILLYCLIGTLRSISSPLQAAWINLRIDDPRVRATIFWVSGQVAAIGQIVGGPPVGALGNASVRAALIPSAALLSPVLPLYGVTIRHDETAAIPQEAQ
jgi:DHA3 family tetracycline resistance protein-like MFS transporter